MLGTPPGVTFNLLETMHPVVLDYSQLIPADPREWTRDHVTLWLVYASSQYHLGNTYPERFPINGKALLLMTRDMFLSRVPHGGGLLFEDVQLKLQKVISERYKSASEGAVNGGGNGERGRILDHRISNTS